MNIVYTDGSAAQKPHGAGGFAWVSATSGRYHAGYQPVATSNRMELMAASRAVAAHPGQLLIVSDSAYVVNCFNERWYVRWLREGLLDKHRGKLKNRDLWTPLVMTVLARGDVTFRHVNGHVGIYWNEHADRLAKKARVQEKTFRGTVPTTPRTITIRRGP